MSPTAARRSTSTPPAGPTGRPARPGASADAGSPGSRPVPTLSGELRGSVLLLALALVVTVGAAAAARLLAGLTP